MNFFFPNFDPGSFPSEEAFGAWEGGRLEIDWETFAHTNPADACPT